MTGKHILVVGGAGYIGSHMTDLLINNGWRVSVADNLSSGHGWAVAEDCLFQIDLADHDKLYELFQQNRFDAVMDFAGLISVGASMTKPCMFYEANVGHTLNLLSIMNRFGVDKFIFSSTAAVYGDPDYLPLDTNHPLRPKSPYGRSKLMVETILANMARAGELSYVSLRYFNAAGAKPKAGLGETHDPETHLIPLLLQTLLGKRARFYVYGDDYPTKDGTCVRDYVHVKDLCKAHELALEYLFANSQSRNYNLGSGKGFTVGDVIQTVEQVTNLSVPVEFTRRRAGDSPRLVADNSDAYNELGWRPDCSDLRTIITDAWQWEKQSVHYDQDSVFS